MTVYENFHSPKIPLYTNESVKSKPFENGSFARCIMGLRSVLKVVFKLMSTDNIRKHIYSNGKFLVKSFNISLF